MDATAWATFWALMGLIVFAAILIYMKVPGRLAAILDNRSATIRRELADARRLREEAQALLAEYGRRRLEAEQEAQDIVAQATREADVIAAEARVKLEDYIARRTRSVESRIAQAETQAIAEVRSRAVDLATAAASRILADQASGEAGARLVDQSIATVRTSLN